MDNNAELVGQVPRKADLRGEMLDLKELISLLCRRKWSVLGSIVFITGLATLLAFVLTPQYTATLQLVFDATERSSFNIDAANSGQPQDEADLLSAIAEMRSRALAGRMIDKLGLLNDAEFNNYLNPSIFAKFVGDTATPTMQREGVIDGVLNSTEVSQIGRSRAVALDFTSIDPVKAAAIANTLGDLFLVTRLESKFENVTRASKWLAEHVQELREQVAVAEKKAEDYRQEHDLLQGERVTLLTEQISALNTQLSDIRRARTEAEANLVQAQHLLSSPEKLNTAVQVLESSLIQRLREEQSTLARREAALQKDLGPRHPQIIQLREERDRLKADVETEVRKVIGSLENKVNSVRRQEAQVVDELNSLKAQMGKSNEATVVLRSIERDAAASQLMLEKFMTPLMEASAQQNISSLIPEARIISAAAAPADPSFPDRPLIIAGGFVFSVLAALLLALALERLDSGFRSAEQLERKTGLQVLAHVPSIPGGKGVNPAQYIIERPGSAFGASIRSLSTRLLLASHHSPPQVVLITSAEPKEGKTSIALSFARMQAKAGGKVVFVDADFHKSTVADTLNVADSPGLLEVISGAASIEEATRKDKATGLDVIVRGTHHSEALHALATGRIDSILDILRTRYDLVIIDSVPTLVLSDAQILAAVADETVLIVRWGTTRQAVAAFAARQLKGTARHLGGAILSQVDVTKLARYNFGDSTHYTGNAKHYYSA